MWAQGSTILSILGDSPDLLNTLIADTAGLLQREDVPRLCKSLCLRLLLTILTATDNVNTNSVAAHLFLPPITAPLLKALAAVFTLPSDPLSADRHHLTQDGALLLLLLLLWRQSSNPYAALLASPAAPLGPLLQAALCLLTPTPPPSQPHPSLQSSAAELVLAYFGWGPTPLQVPPGALPHLPLTFSAVTAGAMLLHFLLRLSPSLTSPSLWPPSGLSSSLQRLWGAVFRAFLTCCPALFLPRATSCASGCLRATLNLHTLRMLLLTMEVLPAVSEGPRMSSGGDAILGLAIGVVGGPGGDPSLASAAMSVISVSLTRAQKAGRHIGAPAVEVGRLWEGLVAVCEWSSQEAHFEVPGAPEAAEAAVGILEFCLGSGAEVLGSAEEVEALHAAVLVALPVLEAMETTSERIPHLPRQQQALSGGIRLVNVAEVRRQYEVTLAAMGVRGHASEAQARAAVGRKGTGGMKLRRQHTHAHTEVAAEQRVLIGLGRLLVTEHRRNCMASVPKVEAEAT